MNCAKALHLLAQHKAQLAKQFGITRLALFGSTVRDACPAIPWRQIIATRNHLIQAAWA